MPKLFIRCPDCQGPARVVESRACWNGSRRRRLHCKDQSCGHRWTEWLGDRPNRGDSKAPVNRGNRGRVEPLTEDQIRLILTSQNRSLRSLADEVGRTAEAVRHIRIGEAYPDVLPEIPRWPSRTRGAITCYSCHYWRGHCGMELPDPLQEGVGCAEDCSLFQPKDSARQASAERSPAAAAR